MNEIQRYLAEEIALDCNAGHITRPEALRRLYVMGLSTAVAAALLAACGGDGASAGDANGNIGMQRSEMPAATSPNGNRVAPNDGAPNMSPGTTPQPPPNTETNVVPLTPGLQPAGMQPGGAQPDGMQPSAMEPAAMDATPDAPPAEQGTPGATVESALPTEAITFTGPNGVLQGALAVPAAAPRGGVLVIHENRGLNDHTRTVAGRLATAGYVAIALDLLSEEGGTASFADAAAATAALGTASMTSPTRFLTDMRAALDELERRAPGAKLGAIGFCFGGGQMWQLLAADARLSAVAPFYGQLPTGADFSASEAAVLAFYGELDTRINMTRAQADTALTAAGLTHEMVTEAGANHAFFNDTGMNYSAAAAADAWTRLIAFFRANLG
jgi:carboxymethylenebutenolidase